MSKAGKLIVFEGVDGTGKSSQALATVDYLRQQGVHALHVRFPGQTPLGAALRPLLFPEDFKARPCPAASTALFLADYLETWSATVAPALAAGKVVVCDRYNTSNLVYWQPEEIPTPLRHAMIESVEHAPDVVFLLLMDPRTAYERANRQRDGEKSTASQRARRWNSVESLGAIQDRYLDLLTRTHSARGLTRVWIEPHESVATIQVRSIRPILDMELRNMFHPLPLSA